VAEERHKKFEGGGKENSLRRKARLKEPVLEGLAIRRPLRGRRGKKNKKKGGPEEK